MTEKSSAIQTSDLTPLKSNFPANEVVNQS